MDQDMTRRTVTARTRAGEPDPTRVDKPEMIARVDSGAEVEELFRSHHDRLLRALYLLTGDADEADELLQEAFLKVWQHWERVRRMDDPPGYLYRTAMNAFRTRWRRRAVERRLRPRASVSADPIQAAVDHAAVMAALGELPPRQRLALVLTEFMDRSAQEAAAVLGVKEVTVRSLASQARATLRRRLELSDE